MITARKRSLKTVCVVNCSFCDQDVVYRMDEYGLGLSECPCCLEELPLVFDLIDRMGARIAYFLMGE